MSAFEPSLWELENEIRKTIIHVKDLVGRFPTEMSGCVGKEEVFQCIEDLQESIAEMTRQSERKECSCRIATWDLKQLSTECAKYEKRIGSMSDTILYYQFDIIAVQEIVEVRALTDIMKLLNRGRHGLWKTKWSDVYPIEHKGVPEKAGFLWNASRVPIEGPIRFTHYHNFGEMKCRPVSLEFFINDWKFELINFHLRAINSEAMKERNECELNTIHEVIQLSRETTKAEYDIILLGNFNCYPGRPRHSKHHCLFRREPTDTAGNQPYDNILVEQEVKSCIKLRQVAEIKVQNGIQAHDVSDHLPIWVDLDYSKLTK